MSDLSSTETAPPAIPQTMKAIVYSEYGPPEVLRPAEIETPTPGEEELLVRVRAGSVSFGDISVRKFNTIGPSEFNMPLPMWFMGRMSFGFRKPKYPILGHEFAGDVVAVGDAVTRFQVDDRVFGFLGDPMGANAEFTTVAQDAAVALIPPNVSYEQAAVVPYGTFIALHLLRKTDIQAGDRVLVNGASGGIGSAVLQLAKRAGAEVTGVAGGPRLEFVRALGADHVIDYISEDFTQNGQTYDLIFDVLGRSSYARCKDSLAPDGRYMLSSFKARHLFDMLRTSIASQKKVICVLAIPERIEEIETVRDLLEKGVIQGIVDRTFPLEDLAEAHRYVEAGLKRGPVAITA